MATPTIAVAYGDGNAPEVMESVLTILREAGAPIRIETVELGSRIYAMDSKTGILPLAWPVLARTSVLLMAPIDAPVGEGITHTADMIRQHMGLNDDALLFIDPTTNIPTARNYIGEKFALFEPIYTEGSLKTRGKSDPSPMLHAAIMMLVHIGLHDTANKIHNAWLTAMEDGFDKKRGKKMHKLTQAIIERLGKLPQTFPAAEYKAEPEQKNGTGQ